MKKHGWICWLIALTTDVSGAKAADRIVGLAPTDGETMMIKEFSVAAGTMILGVQFENNDTTTSFPEISLVRGPLTSIAGGTLVAAAAHVRPGAGNVTLTWASPIMASEDGTYFVAVRFPAGEGKQGVGHGPALGANDITAPNGSYVAASKNDPVIPSSMDLTLDLLTSVQDQASKAEGVRPEPHPGRTSGAEYDELHVRSAMGRHPATIRFELSLASEVILGVYDVSGRLIEEIVRGALPAGMHQREWNGAGSAAGVYFARLETGRHTLTEKIVVTH